MSGRRDPKEYSELIAVVTEDHELNRIRLCPAPGQQYSEEMFIECSKALRKLPIGTKVRIQVVEKHPKDSNDSKHLYTSYKWDYQIVE